MLTIDMILPATVHFSHTSYWMTFVFAFLLGGRHGLDLDHLAAIDTITRYVYPKKTLSPYVGLLFSLGHGVAVTLLFLLMRIFIQHFDFPAWLNTLTVCLAFSFLIFFGFYNLYTFLLKRNAKQRHVKSPSSFIIKFFMPMINHPIGIVIVGSVFAISFETVSQLSLFSIYPFALNHLIYPILLGLIFMIGMMLVDGFHGYTVSLLISKSNKLSFRVSQGLTACIATFAILIGLLELMHFVKGA